MAYKENIERLFVEDIIEKKKAGRGVFSMRGKGVKHGLSGALKTPYHYMTNKEKKKLNGKVEVSNMYETIIPISEFNLKEPSLQRAMMIRWRELYDNSKIKKDLGIANTLYYKIIDELDLPKKARGGIGNVRKGKTNKAAIQNSPVKTDKDELPSKQEELELKEQVKSEMQRVVEQKVITKGLHLEFNGAYGVDDLNKLFMKLQLLVDGETNKYNIHLALSEIVEK